MEETKGQVERLEVIFKKLEVSPKVKVCKAMEGLCVEGKDLMAETVINVEAVAPRSPGVMEIRPRNHVDDLHFAISIDNLRIAGVSQIFRVALQQQSSDD